MYTGDLAVLRRADTYAVGDVVAFGVEGGGRVIHRVIGGDADNGYLIQGDNKPQPDLWRPKPPQILGRMLFHIPAGARVIAPLQDPVRFGVLVAVLMALTVPAAEAARRRRARHTGGRTVTVPNASSSNGLSAGPLAEAPRTVVLAFFVTGVVATLAAVLAVLAFRQSPTQSRMEPRVQYTQSGAFDYGIEVTPAAIYPSGVVRPRADAEAKDAATPEQAVFTRLAQAINVEYRYALESKAGSALSGTLRTDLEIRAVDGWTKTEVLTPPTAFEGAEVEASARIDMRALTALLEQIEAETGFEARSYEVVVRPVVSIQGRVGAEPVQETFTSSLVVQVDPKRVMPTGALLHSSPTTRADLVTVPRMLGAGAWQASVERVRVGAVTTAAGAGVVAAMLAAVIFLGLGRGEEAKIRARYGSLLLHVQASEDETVRDRVRVVSMHDLARLARRDGGLIMEETERLGQRYSVRDGDTVYEFVPEGQARRQQFAEFVMRRDRGPSPSAGNE